MSTKIRIAVLWLYVVAAATLLNSLLLQLFSHFVDLLAGLWFTQANDAAWFGMRSVEPPGSPPSFEIGAALLIDILVALLVVKLARKISRGSRPAMITAFFVYLADTAVFAYWFGVSAFSRIRPLSLIWQILTILVHVAGVVIIFRAWAALRGKSRPHATAESTP
jgi:hypothetical protein